MREIRTLRAMWRGLETGLRRLLHGHEGGNPGHSQGAAYGLPRQFPTLPGCTICGAQWPHYGIDFVDRRQTAALASIIDPHRSSQRLSYHLDRQGQGS